MVDGTWDEMTVTDYTLNPDTQQWENVRFETYLPYCSDRELKSGVVINRNNRFRLAHSIGHLYLHFLPDKSPAPQTMYHVGRSAQQSEAHHFAAALIMPRQAFTYHWHNTTGGDLLKQSELFGTAIRYAYPRAQSNLDSSPNPPPATRHTANRDPSTQTRENANSAPRF